MALYLLGAAAVVSFSHEFLVLRLEEGRERGIEEGRGAGLRTAVLIGALGVATSISDIRAALAAFRTGA